MALFKISKGEKTNLPITYNEGYCYVTTDENKMYIDYEGKGGTSGTRVCLNAANADTIDHYTSNDLVKVNDSLLTTNPFGGKKLYISKLDNSLYAADKRWETSFTVYNEATNEIISTQDCSVLFNGYYDEDYSMCSFESGQYAILRINFGNNYHNTYSYGHYYLSFFHDAIPGEVTARGYCNFSGHGIGWKDFTISYLNQENKTNYIVDIYNSSFQNISQLEITIKFPASTNNARVRCTELEFKPNRPDYNRQPIVSKYLAETLYYPLTAPSFIGNLTGNASTATLLQTTRTINGTDFNGSEDIETSYWGAAKLLKVGYKEISVNGNNHVTWDLHDILLNTNAITSASSWNVLNSGVYAVTGSTDSTFTGEGNPESANGGLEPYRWGQLIVSRAGTTGLAQFYIAHSDSNTSYKTGIKYRTGYNNTYVDTWETILDTSNFNQYAPTLTGTGASGTWGINITGNAATATQLATARTIQTNLASTSSALFDGTAGITPGVTGVLGTANGGTGLSALVTPTVTWTAGTTAGPTLAIKDSLNRSASAVAIPVASASASGVVTTGAQTFAGAKTFNSTITTGAITVRAQDSSHEGGEIILSPATSSFKTGHIDLYDNKIRYHDGTNEHFTVDLSTGEARAQKIYGAVWNDYAEYRTQKDIIEPGYCVTSADNGQVYKTTEKFQACDGIVSDTFGFAIGETDECKTPLAVAGRVLAYCEGNKYDYHSGDTVCAGPNGKIVKMTREEIREWPDRIIGIVSEIPEYETWGTGNVPVNGRIWIKIK